MGSLYAIGEVLIDFIPSQKGRALKDVTSFERVPGGAPANVAAAVAKLGGSSHMISQVGEDAFGDFLIDQLNNAGVNTDKISRTKKANTALAFVSLREDGERDFSFYRNPSADLLYSEDKIAAEWFGEKDILHFCSVDLIESPMKQAHKKAISAAQKNGSLISFDPNVRLPLWDSPEACRNTILDFIPEADIVKISDEELSFITGIENEEMAIASLFKGRVQALIYTKGSEGAVLFMKKSSVSAPGISVKVEDTTGAGDAFIGAFLFQLLQDGVTPVLLEEYCMEHGEELLQFANTAGALTAAGKGAISSLPDKSAISVLLNK